MLQDTVERVFLDGEYADTPQGVYIVRGENVVLLCELDEDKELEELRKFEKTDAKELNDKYALKTLEKKRRVDTRNTVLAGLGFCVDTIEGDAY